jgi:hypothetical protein
MQVLFTPTCKFNLLRDLKNVELLTYGFCGMKKMSGCPYVRGFVVVNCGEKLSW